MLLALPPAPALSGLVLGYWFVQDLAGLHAGRAIRTSPMPLAVLSVNMGRPNAAEDGSLVPRASMLGLQSCARSWRSWADTYFVMAILTVPGIVRLFPHAGQGSADHLLDLGAITGDAGAGYSDQAHQIRSWRRHLGLTPGAYARQPRSELSARFIEAGQGAAPAFYL